MQGPGNPKTVFDESPFRLEIRDKQSGATADTLDNILNLSSFVVKRRDARRRFHCKFTALIVMSNGAIHTLRGGGGTL